MWSCAKGVRIPCRTTAQVPSTEKSGSSGSGLSPVAISTFPNVLADFTFRRFDNFTLQRGRFRFVSEAIELRDSRGALLHEFPALTGMADWVSRFSKARN